MIGIERSLDAFHDFDAAFTDHHGQVFTLHTTHAVFTGNGSAKFNGFLEDFVKGFFHPFHFLGVALVGQACGMEISVTGMTKSSKFQIIFFTDLFNEAQHFRYPAARHCSIFENCCWFAPSQRR